VHAAEAVDGLRVRAVDVLGVAYVALNELATAAEARDELVAGQAVVARLAERVEDNHVRPFCGEKNRGRAADP